MFCYNNITVVSSRSLASVTVRPTFAVECAPPVKMATTTSKITTTSAAKVSKKKKYNAQSLNKSRWVSP